MWLSIPEGKVAADADNDSTRNSEAREGLNLRETLDLEVDRDVVVNERISGKNKKANVFLE